MYVGRSRSEERLDVCSTASRYWRARRGVDAREAEGEGTGKGSVSGNRFWKEVTVCAQVGGWTTFRMAGRSKKAAGTRYGRRCRVFGADEVVLVIRSRARSGCRGVLVVPNQRDKLGWLVGVTRAFRLVLVFDYKG